MRSAGSSTIARAAGRIRSSLMRRPRQVVERSEPPQPLLPRHRGVRGRGRGQDEERRLGEAAALEPVLRPFAERPAIRLLADEGDHAGPQFTRERLEPLRASGKVASAKIARAGRRAVGRIRDADPEWQQVELLGGVEEAWREAGPVQETPEVVAGVREVRVRVVGEPAGVDPAEDDPKPGREDVGNGRRRLLGTGYAASGSRASRRASNARRIRSVRTAVDSTINGSPGRTTLTVSSAPLWP